MSAFLTRISSTRMAAAWLALFLAFMVFVLPALADLIDTISPGLGSPDRTFYYNGETLSQMAQAYGARGRRIYAWSRLTYDLAWPIVYVGFFAVSISWLNNFGFNRESRAKSMNLIPLAAGGLDLLENSAVSIVMLTFPAAPALLCETAGIITTAKWGAVGLSLLALGFSAFHALGKRIRK